MKKLTSILTALILCATVLSGCNKEPASVGSSTDSPSPSESITGTTPTDENTTGTDIPSDSTVTTDGGNNPTPEESFVLGFICSLNKSSGKAYQNGVSLALSEYTGKLKFTTYFEDSNNSDYSVIYSSLVAHSHVAAGGDDLEKFALLPIHDEKQVYFPSWSSENTDIVGSVAARYMAQNALATSAAVIYDYADDKAENFESELSRMGLSFRGAFDISSPSFNVSDVADTKAELIFMDVSYEFAASFITGCEDIGFYPLYIGSESCAQFDKAENFPKTSAMGVYIVSSKNLTNETDAFGVKYKNEFGTDATDTAYMGYNHAKAAIAALEKASVTPNTDESLIYSSVSNAYKGLSFDGSCGKVTFDDKGYPESSYTVYTNRGGYYVK